MDVGDDAYDHNGQARPAEAPGYEGKPRQSFRARQKLTPVCGRQWRDIELRDGGGKAADRPTTRRVGLLRHLERRKPADLATLDEEDPAIDGGGLFRAKVGDDGRDIGGVWASEMNRSATAGSRPSSRMRSADSVIILVSMAPARRR